MHSFQHFEKEKAGIAKNIRTAFSIPVATKPLAFNSEYEKAKSTLIIEKKKGNKDYSSQQFNEEIRKLYSLKVIPDTLVFETSKLLNFLFSTKFEYQYNVPKLDNVDEITFTLNIKPKKGTNGSINVIDKKITVPMKGA